VSKIFHLAKQTICKILSIMIIASLYCTITPLSAFALSSGWSAQLSTGVVLSQGDVIELKVMVDKEAVAVYATPTGTISIQVVFVPAYLSYVTTEINPSVVTQLRGTPLYTENNTSSGITGTRVVPQLTYEYIITDGVVFTLTFQAVQNVTLTSEALVVKDQPGFTYSAENLGQVSQSEPETSPYTVSAVTADSPQVGGGNFTIDVQVAADESTPYAAFQTGFTYDAAKMTFVSGTVNPALGAANSEINASAGTGTISFYGAAAAAGSTPDTVATLTFAPIDAGNDVEFAITNPKYAVSGDTANQQAAAGAVLKFNIAAAAPTQTVTFDTTSKFAPTGYKLLKYVPGSDAGNYTYSTAPMYKVTIEGVTTYVYIVSSSVDDSTALSNVAAGGTSPSATGEMNGDSLIDIVDAQIVHDLVTGHTNYTGDDFTKLTIEQRLNGDVNHDGVLDAADARAIQYYLHYAQYTAPAAP